ncbi:MAG: hypothetical protein IKO80_10425 [Lachnospiraceae bacterium]|nr:hypothetical protein [Lachnospiraceae bacterium]
MRAKRTLAMLLAWGLILTEAFSATGGTVRAAAPEPEMTAAADPGVIPEPAPAEEPESLEVPADTDPNGEESPVPGEEEDISGEDSDPVVEETPGVYTDPDADVPEETALPDEITTEEVQDAGLLTDTPERTGIGNSLELLCQEKWDSDIHDYIQVIEFCPAIVGYTAAQRPAAKEVTVKNTGTEQLTLESPAVTNAALSDQWEISGLKKSQLAPDEETTFTVRPKTGIVARWDGNEWQNTRFDICVKTADGGTEAHIPDVFRVGLIGTELGARLETGPDDDDPVIWISRTFTARDLTPYYGEDDVALLIGDTDIQLTPGDILRIGGFKQDTDRTWGTPSSLSIGGTIGSTPGKLKAGTLQAGILQASSIDITDGIVWADTVSIGASDYGYFHISGGELHVAERFDVQGKGYGAEAAVEIGTDFYDEATGKTLLYPAKVYAECPMEITNSVQINQGSELHVTPGDHEAEGALICKTMYIDGDIYVRDAINENRLTPARAISAEDINFYEGQMVVEQPCTKPGSMGIYARDSFDIYGFSRIYSANSEERVSTPTAVVFSQGGPAIHCECWDSPVYSPAGIHLRGTGRILAQSGDGRPGDGRPESYPAILANREDTAYFNINYYVDPAVNHIALPADADAPVKTGNGMVTVYDSEDRVARTVLIEPIDQETGTDAAPSFTVSANALSLSGVEGEATAPRTLTVTNNGGVPFRIDPADVTLEGADDSLFTVTQEGSVLLPGETLTLTVNRKPDAPGRPPLASRDEAYTATLLIAPQTLDREELSNAETGESLTASIPLTLHLYPAFSLTPEGAAPGQAVHLGEAMEGETLDPVTFTLKNNGTRTRDYDVRIVSYDKNDSNLHTTAEHPDLILDTGAATGFRLAPGAKKTFTVSSGVLTESSGTPNAEGELEINGRLEVYAGDRSGGVSPVDDDTAVVKNVYLSGTVSAAPDGIRIKAIPDQYYSASPLKPVPQVYTGSKKLSAQDYTVTYTNNTNIGTATVTVKGKGNYAGTDSATFGIRPRSVSYATTDTDEAVKQGILTAHQTLTANGRRQTGRFILKYRFEDGREVTLKENTDYTLDYGTDDYTAPGIYTITVQGKGNYTGSRTLKLALTDPKGKTLISKAAVSAIPNQTYCGKSIVLRALGAVCNDGESFAVTAQKNPFEFTVKMGIRLLRCGKDYTLTYVNNKDIGTATVIITGIGDTYTGSVTKTFKITGTALSSAKLHGFLDGILYTGEPVYQPAQPERLWFTDAKGKDLEAGVDYKVSYPVTPIDPGTYEVLFTGMGGYTGTVKKTFKVTDDISYCRTRDMQASYTCTGAPIDPIQDYGVQLVSGAKALEVGTDYTYEITNNENPGTASIVVTAVAPYTGKAKITFKIVACPLDDTGRITILQPDGTTPWTADAAGWDDETWRKSGVKPEPVLIDGTRDCTLIPGTDYTLQWSNNTAAYTAADRTAGKKAPALTVTGKGKYAGKLTRNFLIEPAALSDMTVTATDVTKTSGSKGGFYRNTVVKVTDADGKVLTAGTDYWPVSDTAGHVKFKNNGNELTLTDIPEASSEIDLEIEGKGNYSGWNTAASYHIVKGSIASVPFKINDQTYQYNVPVELSAGDFAPVSSKIGGEQLNLVYGTHYEIVPDSYQNNDKAGTARVTVRGLGTAGLTGTKVVTFKINQVVGTDGTDADRIVVKTRNNAPWAANGYPSYPYTKAPVKPEAVVVLTDGAGHGLATLNNGTDYTLAWSNNTKPRTATGQTADPTVTITLKGNYSGKLTRSFTISEHSLNADDFTLTVTNKLQPQTHKTENNLEVMDALIFKASAMTATLTENASGKKLGSNEFTVSYAYDAAGTSAVNENDVLDPGTILYATVTAVKNGEGEYSGNYIDTYTTAFRVFAAENLGAATITAPADLKYCATNGGITAGKDKFVVKARVGTKMVVLDPSCYQLDNWQDNNKAGTAKVTVSGIAEKGVKGSKTIAVRIAPASISDEAKKHLLKVMITDDDTPQKNYAYEGIPAYYYTKSGIKPIPDIVKLTDKEDDATACVEFERNTDYTVSWRANTKAFTVTDRSKITTQTPVMVLTGKGNLTGKLEIPFTIRKKSINDGEFAISAPDVVFQRKAGNYLLRDVTLTDADGKKLVSGTDYYAATDRNHPFQYYNSGTEAIYVMRNNTVTPVPTYSESPDESELLKDDIVLYEPGAEVRIMVIVTGSNNYSDVNGCSYRMIASSNLNTAKVTINEQPYTGNEIELTATDISVTVRITGPDGKPADHELIMGQDYTITGYENNTNVGTAKVKIEGVREKGFVGSKICTFRIKAFSLDPPKD